MFVMLSGLVACSSESDDSGEEAEAEDQITVEIFQGQVEFINEFKALGELYEEQNPDVNIDFSGVGAGSDYQTALRSRFTSGDEPVVFTVDNLGRAEDYQENLTDLSDMEAVSQALDGTLDGVSNEDGVFGLPLNQEGYGFIYNKRIFEEAGINPDDILTFDDLEEALQTLDSQKEDLGIQAPIALPGAEWWVLSQHLASAFMSPDVNNSVSEMYQSDSIAFEKSNELKKVLDLQNEYSIQPTLNMDYSQQVEQYFAMEEVAMIQQGNWIYPTLQQMDEEFANNNIGMLPIPIEGYEGSIPVGVPHYWLINNNFDDEVVQAAKDFFDWMYTSEEGIAAFQEHLNYVPAYRGFDPEKATSISKEVFEYKLEENTVGFVFPGFPVGWSENLASGMQGYLGDQESWDEVIENAKAEWEEMRE